MSWVLRHSEETQGNRLVLLVLADHAREDGTSAWPAVATIAVEARLSERQVQRCLSELKQSGAIVATGKSKAGTVRYDVLMRDDILSEGDISSMSPLTFTTEKVPQMSPEPSVTVSETSLLPKTKKTDHTWDAMEVVFGEVTNAGSRDRRNRAVKLVKESLAAGGIVEPAEITTEVKRRARAWSQLFPGAALTDMALANGWDRATPTRTPGIRAPQTNTEPEINPLSPEENAARMRDLLDGMGKIGRDIT